MGTAYFFHGKYEAKDDGSGVPESVPAGLPWVSISQLDAKTECASLGKGYHLITNDEWMTIAANAAAQGANWDGGTVGTNDMTRGHSDGTPNTDCAADADDNNAYVEASCTGTSSGTFNQRRTLTLSNGEVIWDLAGNVWEWTSYFNDSDKPSPGSYIQYSQPVVGTSTMPLSDLIPTSAVKSFWNNSWNSTQSIGQYYAGSNGSGGAMYRGYDHNWNRSANAGVFAVYLGNLPTNTYTGTGFRCVVAVP